jgi:hypothetical protein
MKMILTPSVKNHSPMDFNGRVNVSPLKSLVFLIFLNFIGWGGFNKGVYCSEEGSVSLVSENKSENLDEAFKRIINDLKEIQSEIQKDNEKQSEIQKDNEKNQIEDFLFLIKNTIKFFLNNISDQQDQINILQSLKNLNHILEYFNLIAKQNDISKIENKIINSVINLNKKVLYEFITHTNLANLSKIVFYLYMVLDLKLQPDENIIQLMNKFNSESKDQNYSLNNLSNYFFYAYNIIKLNQSSKQINKYQKFNEIFVESMVNICDGTNNFDETLKSESEKMFIIYNEKRLEKNKADEKKAEQDKLAAEETERLKKLEELEEELKQNFISQEFILKEMVQNSISETISAARKVMETKNQVKEKNKADEKKAEQDKLAAEETKILKESQEFILKEIIEKSISETISETISEARKVIETKNQLKEKNKSDEEKAAQDQLQAERAAEQSKKDQEDQIKAKEIEAAKSQEETIRLQKELEEKEKIEKKDSLEDDLESMDKSVDGDPKLESSESDGKNLSKGKQEQESIGYAKPIAVTTGVSIFSPIAAYKTSPRFQKFCDDKLTALMKSKFGQTQF